MSESQNIEYKHHTSTTQAPHKYHISTPTATHTVTPTVKTLLDILDSEIMSRAELMEKLGLRDKMYFLQAYLNPALEAGLIEPTEKPNHPRQKYRRKR